jgi:outer membrane murein-binding lipoprotein Lpp
LRISPRIRLISMISISSLVLLICLTAVVQIWLVKGKVTDASIKMLQAMDESASMVSNIATRVDTGLAKIADISGKIESASSQLEQNVDDRGVVLLLLPETREQELTAAVISVQEDFAAIRELLQAVNETIQAFNRLPFVELPEKGLAAIETLESRIDQLTVLVDGVKADIQAFRSETAGRISKITTAASDLNLQLANIRSNLQLVDSELKSIQVQSRELQELLPTLLTSIAIMVTLLAVWVGYSQMVIIERALKAYREAQNREATLELVDLEEIVVEDMETTPNEFSTPNAPLSPDVESNILEESGYSTDSPS